MVVVPKAGKGSAGFEPAFGIVSAYPHITQDAVLCSASHIPGYGPIRFHVWLTAFIVRCVTLIAIAALTSMMIA